MDIKVGHDVIPDAGYINKPLGVALVGVNHTKVEKACLCILVILLAFDATYVHGNKCIVF
jgi:hypothetical protein